MPEAVTRVTNDTKQLNISFLH